jgi:hypothetical protein
VITLFLPLKGIEHLDLPQCLKLSSLLEGSPAFMATQETYIIEQELSGELKFSRSCFSSAVLTLSNLLSAAKSALTIDALI